MSKKIINVVAAAIEKDGKIFCAQRPEGKNLGGYWEFPGGKLEQGETPEEALVREIKEEFDSEIEIISFLNEASYEYEFGIVTMKTYRSKLVAGNLTLLEHQDSKWLPIEQLDDLEWAPVDIPAVNCLQKR
ncbi:MULTISPECIES: (deoxy)nucleoside triphosphate pyrophosphohydrolase [Streptococcus]|uniref:(deoxy)nucleoside triphosphate pyrophosphohydrolase n=1 Tax=Streptococcus TaxID=1301 RepID=UPI001960B840|nr:(deoxy)nucleoside triphosphate pyrophosphohydrolase [Streptococcus suis]MBM7192491.1 (deoxy)nucleoside triphosphate pyrophosphohydrolase [Streptococcus suis]MCO8224748.1 (deoxy)nucleoside triphosphate pyrophosphohydrolase [Streptococcus suis]QZS51693.1 (deoxy)nucleoside triphosphate pyrophosphohydrolase [Streptococcus suis]QZS61399.1 (deoxy)nucleoside triphosphate pyrophosphohydrolase [Streptococcus suis]HEM3429105.1 (deoxy)nucleoside triphosphate pyrophosphohydrolase [Streptococcus suis]